VLLEVPEATAGKYSRLSLDVVGPPLKVDAVTSTVVKRKHPALKLTFPAG
jgi:hypothetical protein